MINMTAMQRADLVREWHGETLAGHYLGYAYRALKDAGADMPEATDVDGRCACQSCTLLASLTRSMVHTWHKYALTGNDEAVECFRECAFYFAGPESMLPNAVEVDGRCGCLVCGYDPAPVESLLFDIEVDTVLRHGFEQLRLAREASEDGSA